MEIVNRDPQDIISEELIRQITNKINQHIIDSLFGRDVDSENYKKYRDKFDILVMGRQTMPYTVRAFIERHINKEIEEGCLSNSYKDNDGNVINNNIPLDDIHKVTYIYDPTLYEDRVFRMHQTEHQYEMSRKPLEPIYAKFDMSIKNIPTTGNFAPRNTWVKSKYAIIQ